jgi:phosphonate transport system substrate-binding protein
MIRKAIVAAMTVAAAGLMLASCKPAAPDQTLNFSIASAEDQASMQKVWQPLLDDLNKQTGLHVVPHFASNYTSQIEAMQFNQVQLGWFPALSTLQAVRRANGEVLGRIVGDNGAGMSYASVMIVKKGSGITLADVLKCGKRYSFGLGDPESTSGTLAPMAYVFIPNNIDLQQCFSIVRQANHQSNLFGVANGVVDVATNNTIGLLFAKRENPAVADKVEVIWTSPPLPESSIVARKDLDPAIKARLKDFFVHYGTAQGVQGDHERAVLKGLAYGGFREADVSYLDPVAEMVASQDLSTAKKSGDPAKIAAAQKAYDDEMAQIAAHQKAAPAS